MTIAEQIADVREKLVIYSIDDQGTKVALEGVLGLLGQVSNVLDDHQDRIDVLEAEVADLEGRVASLEKTCKGLRRRVGAL